MLTTTKLLRALGLATLVALVLPAFGKEMEETFFLFQNRKVTIVVPDGLVYATNKEDNGLMTVMVSDLKNQLRLVMTFAPDFENQFAAARTRKEYLNERFQDRLQGSVEKAMQFEELEPKVGTGTFCVFTDAALVGKKIPPQEYLHSIGGVKAWPGVFVVFEILANDTSSKDYLAVLKMLRESVQEKPVPLL